MSATLFVLCAAFGSCSTQPPPDQGDGPTSMQDLTGQDLAGQPDLSAAADMSMMPDLSRQRDLSTPPDMAPCTGPDGCGPGATYCCADLTLGAGTPPNCPVTKLTVSCQATCDGKIEFTCPAVDRVRLCKKAADCVGGPGGYSNCCLLNNGMSSQTVCVTNLIKSAIGCTPLP